MLQESGKTVTGHEYPGKRLVQRRQTRPPISSSARTLSQRNQKQPKKKEKSWNGPNRSLCAPQISYHGEKEVYAVSEQWKETLWKVQVTRWNIPPTLSQILFLHIMIHSAKAKPSQPSNKRHILPITTYIFLANYFEMKWECYPNFEESYQLF